MFSSVLILCCFYLLEICTKVEARYCTFESEGELKYYVCQRNEYCCNFGCCLSPTFQFYQLWYYWLMVIFMFLLCSGGQWWYRYWLQGRYAGDLGPSMTYRGGGTHLSQARRPPRPARVAYHPARDAVVLQNIWKPNYPGGSRNSPPPSYSSSSGARGEQCSRDLMDVERLPGLPKPSPYFQLYGPPPSYEQVIRDGGASPAPVHAEVRPQSPPPQSPPPAPAPAPAPSQSPEQEPHRPSTPPPPQTTK